MARSLYIYFLVRDWRQNLRAVLPDLCLISYARFCFFFFFNKVISLTYSFGRSGTCYIVQASPKMTAVGLLLGIGITRVPPSLTCICIFLLKFLLHHFSFWLGQQPFPPDSSTLLSYSNPQSSFSQAHSV